ncbi:HupE/UreJ family protein [uncultured Cocleimonas sp.]|jgi:urease accessory protein|uniref:HupE/UreJ family protein n=1 Tax=uncultured Cocleimonas sp. TaxID=1051587 RepID=UPI0026150E56|nr:HupE/UreJ family protein [uncultured Cocleimonas sp.]
MPSWTKYLWIIILSLVTPETVLAHSGEGITGGLTSGFMHPLAGLDHVAAMVAVGILGAFLGRPAIWVLPVVFPLVMAFGGVLGLLGIPIPYIEVGIAASSLVLGSMILFELKPPLWITAVIVAAFAIFHGHAHGTELPKAASALAYSVGFVVSTGLLHLSGIGFGELIRWPTGKIIARAAGGIIALVGIGFLTGWI